MAGCRQLHRHAERVFRDQLRQEGPDVAIMRLANERVSGRIFAPLIAIVSSPVVLGDGLKTIAKCPELLGSQRHLQPCSAADRRALTTCRLVMLSLPWQAVRHARDLYPASSSCLPVSRIIAQCLLTGPVVERLQQRTDTGQPPVRAHGADPHRQG